MQQRRRQPGAADGGSGSGAQGARSLTQAPPAPQHGAFPAPLNSLPARVAAAAAAAGALLLCGKQQQMM